MKQYKNIIAQLPGNAEDMGTCGGDTEHQFSVPHHEAPGLIRNGIPTADHPLGMPFCA